jgi:carbonic anhydrase
LFRYVAEVHIVHWDTKYGNFVNATKHNDGLAVLGVLVEVNTNIFHLEQKNRILTLVLNGR